MVRAGAGRWESHSSVLRCGDSERPAGVQAGSDVETRQKREPVKMPSAIGHRRDIDGLRAVAVILVLAFHAFPALVPDGFIGVDMFFVISGYLITSIIVRDTFTYKHFYANRVRRIFPALVLVLASVFALGWLLFDPEEMTRLSKSILASSLFFPNFQFWSEVGYFDAASETKPLLHLWSLGVEEQFYVVWPLFLGALVWLKRPVLAPLILVTLVSLAISVWLSVRDPNAAFYAPWSRAWELSLGGIIATASFSAGGRHASSYRADLLGIAAILAISAAAFVLGSKTLLPNIAATLGTAALIWASSGSVNRMLGGRLLVAIGLISYPLYLWHWPLLVFARAYEGSPLSAPQTFVCLGASLGLAAATYWFVEKPIRFGAWRRWSLQPLVAAAALLGLSGFAGVSTQGFPLRFPAEIRDVLAYGHYEHAKDGRAMECWIRNEDPFTAFAPECALKPSVGGQKRLLVWGDSHAARLYAGMRTELPPDVDIAQFTKDSCPPLLDLSGPCGDSNRSVLDEIRRSNPDTVILFAVWGLYGDWGNGATLRHDLAETIAGIKASVPAKIVVVGPAPVWSDALPKLVYLSWRDSGKSLPDRLSHGFKADIFENSAKMADIAKAAGVSYVSLADLFCNEAGCLTHVPANRTRLTSWDYGHLTTDGAAMVTTYMVRQQLLP